jgi:hypothetical protein
MKRIFLFGTLFLLLFLTMGSLSAQEPELVGFLISDSSAGETCLLIESEKPINEARVIVIESRDGFYRETQEVRHVYAHNVIIESPIIASFVSGARIYQ